MASERMKAITTGVMSVELAMQREFVYKQKIEKLERELLQQFNEKDYTPVTDAPNQICAMQSKPVPSQVLNQGEFPTPTPKPYAVSAVHSRSLHCQPASTQPALISGPTPLARPGVNAHPSPQLMPRPSSSLTHTSMKRTEPSSGQQQQFQPPNYTLGDKYFCKLCRVDCQTPYNLHMHLKGSKHKTRAAMMSRGKEQSNAAAASRQIHCELCDVCCTDGHSWKQHIEGKNHFIKKQKKILDYRGSR